jgi:hypothetical protein
VAATVAVLGAAGGAASAGGLTAQAGGATPQSLAPVATTSLSAAATSGDRPGLAQRSLNAARGLGERASRGGSRPALVSTQRATKSRTLPVRQQNVSGAVTQTVKPTDPQDIARSMLPRYGWSADQFSCLNEIYMRESRWNPSAANPYSGAYGIPQALPGDKMAAYGSDWQTNPATQLAWGLSYIRDRYGSPCGAWGFWQAHNWY